jgi:hypothetical protein
MIIRTYKVDSEEHLRELDKLVASLNFVETLEPYRITPSEMALGLGRPLTDDEWNTYFENYPNNGKGKTGAEILKNYKTK